MPNPRYNVIDENNIRIHRSDHFDLTYSRYELVEKIKNMKENGKLWGTWKAWSKHLAEYQVALQKLDAYKTRRIDANRLSF